FSIRWSEGDTIKMSSGPLAKAANAIAAAVLRGTASTMVKLSSSGKYPLARSTFCTLPTMILRKAIFLLRCTVSSKSDFPSKIGIYCLGRALRDNGHNLDPIPPDNTTLTIFPIKFISFIIQCSLPEHGLVLNRAMHFLLRQTVHHDDRAVYPSSGNKD